MEFNNDASTSRTDSFASRESRKSAKNVQFEGLKIVFSEFWRLNACIKNLIDSVSYKQPRREDLENIWLKDKYRKQINKSKWKGKIYIGLS